MVRLLNFHTKTEDIEGSSVVILTGFNPFKMLKVSYKDKNCIVWDYNSDYLEKTLQDIGVSSSSYVPLGSLVRFGGIDPPRSFLLSSSGFTDTYLRIGEMDNTVIWKPISKNKKLTNIGYVLTCGKEPKFPTGLVPKSIVEKSEEDYAVILGEFYLINFEKKLKLKHDDSEDGVDGDQVNGDVILVNSKNPWFKQLGAETNDDYDPFKIFTEYSKYAKSRSHAMIDPNHPNLGYQYTYLSRKYIPEVETFTGGEDESWLTSISRLEVVIIIAIFLLLVL